MKVATLAGIALILVGIAGLATMTAGKKNQLVDVAPETAAVPEQRSRILEIPPLVAVLALTSGVALVIISARR
jgi:hypothetical protein